MPYSRDQAVAVFLDIKKKRGERAAKKFGKKHSQDFKGTGRRTREYQPRGRRNG
jgi:hypothetical protein